MSTAASAVTTVDSATTQEAQPTQYNAWDEKGTPIVKEPPKTSDSATDKKPETKSADSADPATAKTNKTADTASDSATDTKQKPNLKTSEDTDRRFREVLDEIKALRRENEELRRGKPSETRDSKQESQPAAEEKEPKPLKEFLEEWFAKNPGKKYEDGTEAWAKAREEWNGKSMQKKIDAAIAADRARQYMEATEREINSQIEQLSKTYPDAKERTEAAAKQINEDKQIPFAVRAILQKSPVFVDLMYVLSEPKALADLVQTAKTDPATAIRKIVITEQLIAAEKAKGKSGAATETARDESGKFVSSEKSSEKSEVVPEPKPRAPKPPSEVGGRGTASEDSLATAAKAGDFRSFEAEQNRRLFQARR